MAQTRLRVKYFFVVISMSMLPACISAELPLEKQSNSKNEIGFSLSQTGLQDVVNVQQDALDQMGWVQVVGSRGHNIPSELTMLGASKVEAVDLGFTGKLGQSVIFAADKRLIPNYDRLYWVMIRVLSEKYGCFIRKKIDRGELVAFKCRDQRIVTFRRRLTEKYAVFKARQYRSDGREIVILNKRYRGATAARVVAKQP